MKPLFAAAALLLVAATAHALDAKAVAGRWALERDPSQVMTLAADGTGAFSGQPLRWKLQGDRLTVTDAAGGTDVSAVRLQGDQLVVVGPTGVPVGFRRVGAAPATAAAKAGAPGRPAANGAKRGAAKAGAATDAQLRQLLLANAWCSFSYRATPGGGGFGDRTSTTRVVFRADGTGSRAGGTETYSTGTGGQYAGAGRTGEPFRWKVKAGRLLVDSGAGFEDVNLDGKRNSNGAPILTAGGVEYMVCR